MNVNREKRKAGHMMYIHKASHVKFKKDIAAFIQWASGK